MNQRWLTWTLAAGAFVVTLAASSWYEGLWSSSDESVTQGSSTAAAPVSLTDPAQMPARPFGPTSTAIARVPEAPPEAPSALAEAPPVLAAATPAAPAIQTSPPEEAPPEITHSEPQTEPYNTPDVDNGEMQARMDRAAAHSSRSH